MLLGGARHLDRAGVETLVERVLPGDWYVVLDNKSLVFAAPTVLALLSQGAEVVTCFIEEHVMASEASQWAGGERVWHIGHPSDQGIVHLDAVGQPPSCFEDLRTSNMTHQKKDTDGDVDYLFDVSVEVAQTLCGFRHDVDPPVQGDGGPYEVLEPVGGAGARDARPKKSFWTKLFG